MYPLPRPCCEEIPPVVFGVQVQVPARSGLGPKRTGLDPNLTPNEIPASNIWISGVPVLR